MKDITKIPQQEVDAWRSKNDITIEGDSCPGPARTFEECPFPQSFLARFSRLGFKSPTPVQSQGWPMALTGRDVVCVAETGSGKTLGFALPAVIHIQNQAPLQDGDGPIAVVVAPTRELANQIEAEVRRFADDMKINIVCVYGGAPKRDQERELRKGAHMIVCTPGRMLDFLERKTINLWRTTFIVFDEADRMLDMGFENQIRALMNQIRPDRQMLMFSATWPKEVRKLAEDFLPHDKIVMKIGTDDGKANPRITQKVIVVSGQYQKKELLNGHLGEYGNEKMLIFTSTKRMADELAYELEGMRYRCAAIHGDKRQEEREATLSDFKKDRINIMIATDVASRGIHVKDIKVVINYDFPHSIEDYIHRIGRTGRAGTYGDAITYFDARKNGKKSRKFVKILEESNQEVPDQLRAVADGGSGRDRGRQGGRDRNDRGEGRGRREGFGNDGGRQQRGYGSGPSRNDRFNPY